MSFIVTIAGQSFTLPTEGDENWAAQQAAWSAAVSVDLLQRSGGTFTLTNNVNFGASFGLIAAYFTSRTANASTSGAFRLARADSVGWRNQANGGNLLLGVDSSDRLTYNGEIVQTNPGGVVTPGEGGTGISSYTAGDMLYATASTTLAKLAIGTVNFVQVSTGSAPSWALIVNANVNAAAAIAYSKLALTGSIVDADINASAAIARSKLASGTASYVLINSGGGVMSEEQFLDKTRGGTGITSTATFPSSGVVVTEAASETLTNKTITSPSIGGTVAGSATYTTPVLTTPTLNGFKAAISAVKTANYTALVTDNFIQCDSSGGTFTITLPAGSNTGQRFVIKKQDSSFTAVSISGTGLSTTLDTIGEVVEVTADGTNWQVIRREIPSIQTAYTPTAGGLGTLTGISCFYKRIGDSLFLLMQFTVGTVAGSTATLTLPGSLTADGSKMPASATLVGEWIRDTSSANSDKFGTVLIAGTSQTLRFGTDSYAGSTSPFTALNGNQAFGNGNTVALYATVAITGWNG